MRLGRMLAALAAGESETHALVALMEIQASRLRSRTGSDGEIVTLDKQDRARWDRLLITHGLAALDRAEEIGGTGSYAIQAKIAACHARAPRAEDTDWVRIASLYGDLVAFAQPRDDTGPADVPRRCACTTDPPGVVWNTTPPGHATIRGRGS